MMEAADAPETRFIFTRMHCGACEKTVLCHTLKHL